MSENSTAVAPAFIEIGEGDDKRRLAYRASDGGAPTIVWLGGFKSDMLGTKAERLSAFAAARGLGFCRFDYSGHGESSGRFEDGTISQWLADSRAVFDAVVRPPAIVVGSSMGGWIALRLIQELRATGRGQDVAGVLLLAPAPDFTARLVEPQLSDDNRRALTEEGFFAVPSDYSPEPTIYTRALIEDGRRNAVMTGLIETGCPIHIIQGMTDPDVPYTHAIELVSHLPAESVVLTLVKDGDHRLSREADLARMERSLEEMISALKDAGALSR
ncbi:alpha/beta hydrolase [Consotaella salsifontis]|uniref:Palmitoyl-protein thioesterase ABHD10, mitochondrial n=1 Tax=Consotaella salsifontis TaxID=1365950 RepID=A0A1T4QVM2_9HYPH|nr:alpha/beta hydrolase [Consotaella salsifontis]SKA07754.1 Pimeloyl-ACP methyl ester carboxylesterase [Consotaella salsifontis]